LLLLSQPDDQSELNPENSSTQNDPHQPVSGLQQQQQQQPHEATTNIQTDFCTQRKRVNGILFLFIFPNHKNVLAVSYIFT
jgi:hypothetical protein